MSNFYILELEKFATAIRRCIGAINKLVDGQLVDYTYDGRSRRGRMHKFIIRWSTVKNKNMIVWCTFFVF